MRQDRITENDLAIDLSSIIQITDFDGDTTTAAANALAITVDDDTPTASLKQLTGTVDEDGVPGGIAGGTATWPARCTSPRGLVTTLFNSGADQPADLWAVRHDHQRITRRSPRASPQ